MSHERIAMSHERIAMSQWCFIDPLEWGTQGLWVIHKQSPRVMSHERIVMSHERIAMSQWLYWVGQALLMNHPLHTRPKVIYKTHIILTIEHVLLVTSCTSTGWMHDKLWNTNSTHEPGAPAEHLLRAAPSRRGPEKGKKQIQQNRFYALIQQSILYAVRPVVTALVGEKREER